MSKPIRLVATASNTLVLESALLMIKSFSSDGQLYDSDKWNMRYRAELSKESGYSTKNYLHLYSRSDNHLSAEFHNHPGEAVKVYNLPEEWTEFMGKCEAAFKPEYKVGDWVTVKPEGFNSKYANHVKVGDTFQIADISNSGLNDSGKWISDVSNNYCCMSFLRPATEKEILAVTQIKIAGYVSEIKDGGNIAFGCQTFTRVELLAYRKLLSEPISGTITIQGVDITVEILDKLLALIKK